MALSTSVSGISGGRAAPTAHLLLAFVLGGSSYLLPPRPAFFSPSKSGLRSDRVLTHVSVLFVKLSSIKEMAFFAPNWSNTIFL